MVTPLFFNPLIAFSSAGATSFSGMDSTSILLTLLFCNANKILGMELVCGNSFTFLSKLAPVLIHHSNKILSWSVICGFPFGGICCSSTGSNSMFLYIVLVIASPA